MLTQNRPEESSTIFAFRDKSYYNLQKKRGGGVGDGKMIVSYSHLTGKAHLKHSDLPSKHKDTNSN
jgi:hypothetical protein